MSFPRVSCKSGGSFCSSPSSSSALFVGSTCSECFLLLLLVLVMLCILLVLPILGLGVFVLVLVVVPQRLLASAQR